MFDGVGKIMNIELCGVDVEVIEVIHANMPKGAECLHNPGQGRIWIDNRNWSDRDVEKAIHYLLSL